MGCLRRPIGGTMSPLFGQGIVQVEKLFLVLAFPEHHYVLTCINFSELNVINFCTLFHVLVFFFFSFFIYLFLFFKMSYHVTFHFRFLRTQVSLDLSLFLPVHDENSTMRFGCKQATICQMVQWVGGIFWPLNMNRQYVLTSHINWLK